MNDPFINIYLTSEAIYKGRELGLEFRKLYSLDNIDNYKDYHVNIFIAPHVLSVNTSFFLGCFGLSVQKLGEDGFREKYLFHCDDVIKKCIDLGINRSLHMTL